MTMDYKEMMAHAPKDCQPTVITEESRQEEWAKRLGKKASELTEEEKQAEAEDYAQTCWTPCDWMNS